MAYKALYRTYRPKDFEEIAGQEHITRTFKNALKNNKIAHAYLFSGPRGTGKTSIAKIIAKAVNCEHAPVSNPCNECDICLGIENNTISDVIEIDAASNNGVDEIREIRDKVKYLPGVGKYKVYIIDEVHMLSTGAFNALLKTLEEPPKHVIFILATTEPHKIPATIHSRCQRFDFRGVSVNEMITRMSTIIEEEHIEIEKQAIKVIAEAAEGGMRDAISLLDQVISYTDKKVTIEDVHAIRGTVSNEKLLLIAQSLYENNSVKAIKELDELIDLGKEAKRLVENMIKFYRDLLIFKNTDTENNDQLLFSNDQFIDLAKKLSNNLIFFYIEVLNKAQNDMKWTNNATLYMELALIKMVDKVEKQEIIFEDELNQIKQQLQSLRQEVDETPKGTYQKSSEEKVTQKPTERVEDENILKTEQTEDVEESSELVSLFGDDEVSDTDLDTLDNSVEENHEETNAIETFDPNVSFNTKKIDPVTKETEVEVEEEISADLFSIEPEEEINEEPYTTYDVRIVEDVLNNGDREAKIKLNKAWFDIERVVDPGDLQYAKLISSGRVVATNGKMIIIEYPSPSTCNRMMMPEIKEKVVKLLSDFHQIKVDYLALPKEVWEEKSAEFVKKWRTNKDAYINLSKIEHEGLKDIPVMHHKIDDFTPDSVKDAYHLFGSENVKVKKGD